MKKRVIDNIVIAVVLLIILSMAAFAVYRVERQKAELARMAEEQDRIEKLERELREQQEEMRQARLEELKKEKEENAIEIIDFHEQYVLLWDDFSFELENLSENMNSRAVNLEEIKELTNQRIEATELFIEDFTKLEVPEVLGQFYDYQLEFLKNDYNTWSLTYAYYNSRNYSNNQTEELDLLHQENLQLFEKAKAELIDIYEKYDLTDLAQELY